ncbi:apolipophorins-like [Gigantopelta aegis]|uniref:apolipophorins-like n=1 Tax=Gigantopelta aegis TaxID=1735272 RepID=UPI001B889A60|nr:apolipophorins-like [Gigantopelta aegis]
MWTKCVVLLALVARTDAGPINIQHDGFDNDMSCAIYCPENVKFQYTPGTTYQHDYSVQVETTMENAYEDSATLEIAAVVNIEVLSKCDLAMTLHHVKIVHSSETKIQLSPHFKMSLERNPLRFSFHDGEIPNLCPVNDEEKWVLNFKRGVLSTIQNTMDNLEHDQKTKESDVTGECFTEYKVTNRGWYSTTVKKSKDLIGCNDRHGYQSSIHAMPYSASSKIQSLPLMKSTHECEQELDKSGFLKSATCREVHVFRPFSKENSGAVTKVSQKITNTGQFDGISVAQDVVLKRVNLLFEHERLMTSDDHRHSLISKLDEICTATAEDIRPEVPGIFAQLVSIMKNLDSETIRDVYSQILDKSICKENNRRTKQFFLDAIPMAGTASATRVLKEMIIGKEVSDHVTKMWLMSLAFVQDPCYKVLMEAKVLLDNPATSLQSMLPVSTLVNNYCKQHASCENDQPVIDIVNTLLKHIEPGCFIHSTNVASVLQALRALGNVGHVVTVTRSISQCFLMMVNPDEVKISAVQAYRRLPCSADRSDVLNVFTDLTLDSELRIEAYLATMQCPDDDVIEIVRQTLTRETDKQVGSFVWSHITNLMESSSPHKQNLKTILKDENLLKEFDLEKMKYSRNYEGSVFIDKFNIGALADSNLIWSGKSLVPRSAVVNITVDLFGNSINLFEIGGRLEGLEYLLETYLGPYGYFSEKKTKKSAAKSKLNLDQLKASGYMRMFGNELSFLRMHGVDKIKGFNFLKFLIDLSANHDYSFTQSVLFLDSSLIVPTGCGLPLNLTVNGAATIDLKASGKIDLRKIHTSPRSLLVDGVFQPRFVSDDASCISFKKYYSEA